LKQQVQERNDLLMTSDVCPALRLNERSGAEGDSLVLTKYHKSLEGVDVFALLLVVKDVRCVLLEDLFAPGAFVDADGCHTHWPRRIADGEHNVPIDLSFAEAGQLGDRVHSQSRLMYIGQCTYYAPRMLLTPPWL
jgi:hypothetical protein